MNVRKFFLSELFLKQEGRCNLCFLNFKKEDLIVDHILAKCLGGIDNLENLQLLCFKCHDEDKTPKDLLELKGRRISVTE